MAVNANMTVIDQLPGLHQRTAESSAEDDVIKAGFEQNQQVFTGHAAHLLGFAKDPAERLLEHAVGVPQFLLLDQLLTLVRDLVPHTIGAMLTGAVTAPFEQAVILGVDEYIDAEATHELTFWACEFGHSFASPVKVLLKTVFILMKPDSICQLFSDAGGHDPISTRQKKSSTQRSLSNGWI